MDIGAGVGPRLAIVELWTLVATLQGSLTTKRVLLKRIRIEERNWSGGSRLKNS